MIDRVLAWVLATIVLLLVVFVIRWWALHDERRRRRVDEKIRRLLDPIEEKLSRGREVTMGEIKVLVQKPHVRPILYAMLKHFERLDLFPQEYLDTKSQAESLLERWLLRRNDLAPNGFSAVWR